MINDIIKFTRQDGSISYDEEVERDKNRGAA